MATSNIKKAAHELIESLPEDSGWDELMYHIYVRQAIEAGLEDSDAGRTIPVEKVLARFEHP